MQEYKVTLRAARINRGLSQEAAASALNVSSDTLSNWERGKTYPDVPHIERIQELYGVKYDNIIFLLKNNA